MIICTVIPKIQAAGTIPFWGSEGRVLIKGGLYLRAGSILQLFKIVQKMTKISLISVKNAIFTFFSQLRVQFKGGYYSTAE